MNRLGIALLPADDQPLAGRLRGRAGGAGEGGGGGRLRDPLCPGRSEIGVGARSSTSEVLVAERDSGGRFRDLADLAGRIDTGQALNKRTAREPGLRPAAFDSLHGEPASGSSMGAELLIRHAAVAASERDCGPEQPLRRRCRGPGDPARAAAGRGLAASGPAAARSSTPSASTSRRIPLDAYEEALLDGCGSSAIPSSRAASTVTRQGSGSWPGSWSASQERTSRTRQNSLRLRPAHRQQWGQFEVVIFSRPPGEDPGAPGSRARCSCFRSTSGDDESENLRLMAQDIQILDEAVAKKANRMRGLHEDTRTIM